MCVAVEGTKQISERLEAVTEYYSDSGTKRNFTRHHLSVLFTSPNASSVTKK